MPDQILRPYKRCRSPLVLLGVVVVLASGVNASSSDADMAGGARAPRAAQPEVASTTEPLTTLMPVLQATNRRRFAGRRVVIEGVRVQQVVGGSILLVGPTAGDTLAVRTAGRVRVSAGSIVRLEGTVRLVPASLDGWTLDAVERHVLATGQVFIEADLLQPAAPGSRW